MTTAPRPTWSGPYVDPINDGWMGSRVAECLGIEAPYSDEDLISFFENLVQLYDAYREEVDEKPAPQKRHPVLGDWNFQRTKVTDEMLVLIQQRVRQNIPTPDIRAEIKQQFGVDISPSHMSHMKRRINAKDNL